jgi:superfamily II DNA or RNA helicase
MIYILDYNEELETKEMSPTVSSLKKKSPIQLRDYQEEAYQAAISDLKQVNSAYVVLATGLGKTILFSKIIENWPGRVLVLVNREELLQNAYTEIEQVTGEVLGIERAAEYGLGERIIVGTIQTVERKLNRYKPHEFSLIIIDECHNSASNAYKRVFDYFASARRLGFTATDARADGKLLPYERCSYRMGIQQGIEQGYLVPIQGRRIVIESIDLTKVKLTKDGDGDFDLEKLDEEMLKGASAIADVIANDYAFSRGILFFPGCASALLTSELINKRLPGCSIYIDGKTTGKERRTLIGRLRNGDANWLCNVGIACEGFNWPEATVIGMCSPTTSQAAYVQKAGRGTRPLAGLLNGVNSPMSRIAAIGQSTKPYMTILDFVGVSATLNLITNETFLGTNEKNSEEVRERTSGQPETSEEPGQECDIQEVLPGMSGPRGSEFRRIASGIQSRTVHLVEEFDAIDGLSEPAEAVKLPKAKLTESDSLTEKQYNLLRKFGIDDPELSAVKAKKIIGVLIATRFNKAAAQKLYRNLNAASESEKS